MIAVWFWDEALPIPAETGEVFAAQANTIVTAASLRDALELMFVNIGEAAERGASMTAVVLWDGIVQGMLVASDGRAAGLWTELAQDLLEQIESDARRAT